MVKKLSVWAVNHRSLVLGILLLVTLLFAFQIKNISIRTDPSDLLPSNHPFMNVHNKYKEQLGGSFKVFLMLQVKEGDIYNKETLEKIVRLTEGLDAIPGVNHDQIYPKFPPKL